MQRLGQVKRRSLGLLPREARRLEVNLANTRHADATLAKWTEHSHASGCQGAIITAVGDVSSSEGQRTAAAAAAGQEMFIMDLETRDSWSINLSR